jgi:dinuclear metal center YbgI/SA1388 family protein
MSGVAAVSLAQIAAHLDALLRIRDTPDYSTALNGVQVEHRGPVTKIAAAVDTSARTIKGAADAGANLLLVHHGLFWGGLQPLTGPYFARVRLLMDHDIALYSAHLPLDAHPTLGNSFLLAREIGLEASGGFAHHETIDCGVRGTSDVPTTELVSRLNAFANAHGGAAIASAITPGRRTLKWAICSGAGVNADTIREAQELGVDTLITGEGPHWSAVDAEEKGLVIVYAGHYATETTGVRALAEQVSATFSLPWTFIAAPTGL